MVPRVPPRPHFSTPQPPMLTTTKQYILPLSTFPYSKSKATHADTPHRKSSQTKSDESIGIGQPPIHADCRHITLISDLMRINRKGFLRVPTYLLTLQPPNTTFFPLIGSLSSTILVSTLHHHLFIDPIAFIYSHH